MAKFTTSIVARKRPSKHRRSSKTAKKPYEGFPLTPHPSGRWCKKIRGRLHYFGKLCDPDAALERFNQEWPYLKDGRTPPAVDTGDGCTVRLLCNAFLTSKRAKLDSGELSPRSFKDYFNTCAILVDQFGRDRRVDDLRPDDFESLRKAIARTRGLVSLKNEINRCRMVLKYGFDQRLIDRPVHFGQSFDRPSAKSLRKARHERGEQMFRITELTRILSALEGKPVQIEENTEPVRLAADSALKAMTLLGLNCGFGNTDVASLPLDAVDLSGGWITFPRPKTGIPRRIHLWAETVAALRSAIEGRHEPRDPESYDLVFVTIQGRPWVRAQSKRAQTEGGTTESIVSLDALSQRFARLLRAIGINGHRNFYTLRHVFETVAGETKDQVAVDAIMGHVDPSMGALYRERISDERLRAVTEHVRARLFRDATETLSTPAQISETAAHKSP